MDLTQCITAHPGTAHPRTREEITTCCSSSVLALTSVSDTFQRYVLPRENNIWFDMLGCQKYVYVRVCLVTHHSLSISPQHKRRATSEARGSNLIRCRLEVCSPSAPGLRERGIDPHFCEAQKRSPYGEFVMSKAFHWQSSGPRPGRGSRGNARRAWKRRVFRLGCGES